MKRVLSLMLACGILMITGTAWSYSVGSTDVGELDTFIRAAKVNSGNEESWILNELNWSSVTITGVTGWQNTATPGVIAVDFGSVQPEYFFVKTGYVGVRTPPKTTPDHFLFENVGNLNWGVISTQLSYDGLKIKNIGKISHTGYTDPVTSVPEPGSLLLLGLGLIGVGAVARRKIKK
ncbi:MAG TPA: hypothetical protein DCR97_05670 [Deltaproteobacteria bacterium]|nr:hypothetical protein [Deltaproteobacteria bacterium]